MFVPYFYKNVENKKKNTKKIKILDIYSKSRKKYFFQKGERFSFKRIKKLFY